MVEHRAKIAACHDRAKAASTESNLTPSARDDAVSETLEHCEELQEQFHAETPIAFVNPEAQFLTSVDAQSRLGVPIAHVPSRSSEYWRLLEASDPSGEELLVVDVYVHTDPSAAARLSHEEFYSTDGVLLSTILGGPSHSALGGERRTIAGVDRSWSGSESDVYFTWTRSFADTRVIYAATARDDAMLADVLGLLAYT